MPKNLMQRLRAILFKPLFPDRSGSISQWCALFAWMAPLGIIGMAAYTRNNNPGVIAPLVTLLLMFAFPGLLITAFIAGLAARNKAFGEDNPVEAAREKRRAGAGLRMIFALILGFGVLIILASVFTA